MRYDEDSQGDEREGRLLRSFAFMPFAIPGDFPRVIPMTTSAVARRGARGILEKGLVRALE